MIICSVTWAWVRGGRNLVKYPVGLPGVTMETAIWSLWQGFLHTSVSAASLLVMHKIEQFLAHSKYRSRSRSATLSLLGDSISCSSDLDTEIATGQAG